MRAIRNLSEKQKTEYKIFRMEVEERISAAMKKRKENFIQLQNEFNTDKPDINAVAEVLKTQINKMPIFMADNLDLFTKFYSTLDENQQSKVIETIRKKMVTRNSYHSRGKSWKKLPEENLLLTVQRWLQELSEQSPLGV